MDDKKTQECIAELNAVLDKYQMDMNPQLLIDNKGVQLGMQILPRSHDSAQTKLGRIKQV